MVREASPVAVFSSPNTSAPAVACDLTNCRFVWVTGSTLFTRTSNLALTVFTPAVPVVIAAVPPHTQAEPTISSGTQFVIAWTDTIGAVRSIQAARFDSAGLALDPNGFAVTVGTRMESKPRVASSPSKAIISWLNGDDGRAATRSST